MAALLQNKGRHLPADVVAFDWAALIGQARTARAELVMHWTLGADGRPACHWDVALFRDGRTSPDH